MHVSGAAWFYQKDDCCIDNLPGIPQFVPNFRFLTKFSIFGQIFDFWSNFRFLIKFLIFDQILFLVWTELRHTHLPDSLKHRKLMGVCVHPKYGGYFSARAVVMTNETVEKPVCSPVNVLTNKSDITRLLVEMNTNWKDAGF